MVLGLGSQEAIQVVCSRFQLTEIHLYSRLLPITLSMQVSSGSPAAKAGLKNGDIVLEVNAQPVADCDPDVIWVCIIIELILYLD